MEWRFWEKHRAGAQLIKKEEEEKEDSPENRTASSSSKSEEGRLAGSVGGTWDP